MRILLSSSFELKSCNSLDVWLMSIFQHNCSIYLALDTKSRGIEFLLGSYSTVINDSILVFIRIHHLSHPLLDVLGCQPQVLQGTILRNL